MARSLIHKVSSSSVEITEIMDPQYIKAMSVSRVAGYRSLVFLAFVWLLPLLKLSAQVTVISSLPYTVNAPGHYELQSNLSYGGGREDSPPISVNASDVVIDLNHYRLVSTASSPGGGVECNGNQVSVENGVIENFSTGLTLSSQSAASNLLVLIPDGGIGISVVGGKCSIEHCRIFCTKGTGAMGISVMGEQGPAAGNVQIITNTVANFTIGVYCESTKGCAIMANYIGDCSTGLSLDHYSAYTGDVFTHCATDVIGGIHQTP
jgi:hypothetical protein